MDFKNAKELLALCHENNMTVSTVMRMREMVQTEKSEAEINARMMKALEIMKTSAASAINEDLKSMGGLIGGEAKKLNAFRQSGSNICGSLLSRAIMYAMGILEVNATMGVIVAAPTAGSCGVVPGLLLAMQEEYGFSDEKIIDALKGAQI